MSLVNDAPVAVADVFTGDPDVVSIAFRNGVQMFTNDGTGTFVGSGQSFPGSSGLSIAQGDLNGDGFADVVVSTPDDGPTLIYMNDGAGQLSGPQPIYAGSLAGGSALTIADVNGDGSADIVESGSRSAEQRRRIVR